MNTSQEKLKTNINLAKKGNQIAFSNLLGGNRNEPVAPMTVNVHGQRYNPFERGSFEPFILTDDYLIHS